MGRTAVRLARILTLSSQRPSAKSAGATSARRSQRPASGFATVRSRRGRKNSQSGPVCSHHVLFCSQPGCCPAATGSAAHGLAPPPTRGPQAACLRADPESRKDGSAPHAPPSPEPISSYQDSLSDTGERGRKPFFSSRKGGFFLFFSSFLLLCAAGRTGSVPRRVPPRGRKGALPDTSGHTFRGLNLLTASRIHLPADDVGHSDAKYTVGCVHRNPSLVPQQGDEAPHTADAPPPPPGQIAQRRHHLSMLHPDATARHDNLRRFGGKTGHHVQVDQRGRLTVRLLFLPDGTIQEFTRNENKSVLHIHSF